MSGDEQTPAPQQPQQPQQQQQVFRYEFFAVLPNGAIVQVPIQVISPEAIDSPAVSGLRDQVYRALLKQYGLAAFPRPTHYSAAELLELPPAAAKAGSEPSRGVHLVVPLVPQNGTERGGGGPGA